MRKKVLSHPQEEENEKEKFVRVFPQLFAFLRWTIMLLFFVAFRVYFYGVY